MIVQFNWGEGIQESKVLYFSLSNCFQLNPDVILSPKYKLAGVYGIFKKGKCYYVGQSKNVASRITTHITGAYSECDEIRVFGISNGFPDFYERSEESQTGVLENNECWYINTMKPIENIAVDRDRKPKKNQRIHQFASKKNIAQWEPCFRIYYSQYGDFTIVDGAGVEACHSIDHRLLEEYFSWRGQITEYLNKNSGAA